MPESSIDVPEIPLSYRFTGARNIVIPMAFIIPAAVRPRNFFRPIFFSSFSSFDILIPPIKKL